MDFTLNTYKKYPLELDRGVGSYVYSGEKEYLDFYGGHAVAILGHCPKVVVDAVKSQVEKLIFYSNVVSTKPQEKLASLLVSACGGGYKVFFVNSGSEANETAIKIARKWADKKRIISFDGSFHGRGSVPCACTGIKSYRNFSPNFDNFTDFANFGNINSVENIYKKNETAAVILESIQSIFGAKMANADFYSDLRDFCSKNKILLIADEVQTGLGRTGDDFYFSEKMQMKADIITLAKGIASGLPISAVLIKNEIASAIGVGEYATTFGGAPLVCQAGVATVSEILKKGFLADVKIRADYLRNELIKIPNVAKIHGDGFLIGVELKKNIENLVLKVLEKRVIIGGSYCKNIYRLLPPINISKKEIDFGVGVLRSVIS